MLHGYVERKSYVSKHKIHPEAPLLPEGLLGSERIYVRLVERKDRQQFEIFHPKKH